MCLSEETGLLVEGEEEGVCVERFGKSDECTQSLECKSNICSPGGRCVSEINISADSTIDSCADFHN
jgi:hypothetical protein